MHFSFHFAVACSKGGDLSVCYQRRVICHHSHSDGVHIRKVKQLLFIVMYRACHHAWCRTSVEERECNV